jgi:hypothetical protein
MAKLSARGRTIVYDATKKVFVDNREITMHRRLMSDGWVLYKSGGQWKILGRETADWKATMQKAGWEVVP